MLPTLYEDGADAIVNWYGVRINIFPSPLRLYVFFFLWTYKNKREWKYMEPTWFALLNFRSFLLFSLEAYFLILPKGNVDVIKKKKENREHINILRKVPFNICKHVWHIVRRHNDIYITSRLCPPHSNVYTRILKTRECIYRINRSRRTFIYGWWHKQYNNPLLLSDEEEHTHNYWIAQTKISSKYWAFNPPSIYAHIRIYK